MDQRSLWISAIVVAVLLALANVWRGAVLIRAGERRRGNRHMLIGAAMMALTTAMLLLTGP